VDVEQFPELPWQKLDPRDRLNIARRRSRTQRRVDYIISPCLRMEVEHGSSENPLGGWKFLQPKLDCGYFAIDLDYPDSQICQAFAERLKTLREAHHHEKPQREKRGRTKYRQWLQALSMKRLLDFGLEWEVAWTRLDRSTAPRSSRQWRDAKKIVRRVLQLLFGKMLGKEELKTL
jgi:hypothetical protein